MKTLSKRLDWATTLTPLAAIILLCLLFLAYPDSSAAVLSSIRFFLGDRLGTFYLTIGLGVFLCRSVWGI